jgi:Type IV secretory system Conjugative DNA transfer
VSALLAIAIVGVALLASVLFLRAGITKELQADPVTYRLSFPAGLEADSVTDFLMSLSGLLLPWWRRWLGQPVVTLEVRADADGIEHQLVVAGMSVGIIEAALTAHVPSVRYERLYERSEVKLTLGAEYRTTTDQRQLRIDVDALSAGLLSTLQPLLQGEQVVLQWVLTPAGPVRPPRLRGKQDGVGISVSAELLTSADAVTALKAKRAEPLLLAVGRIAVAARSRGHAETILRRVEAPMHGTRAPGVHLTRRLLPGRLLARRVERQSVPLTRFPSVLNTLEATSLIGWPAGITQLPGLTLGGCRLLPVASAVSRVGTQLGTSTFPATVSRPVALDLQSRLVHLHAIGPTGSGKSTLLANVVLSDIAHGYGVVVIDPKGDLITPILERMEERRLDNVIVLDAADDERPVGYNPLSTTDINRELVVDQVLGVMHAIWHQSWGPRLSEILHASLMTLSLTPGMTLAEIPRLLTDDTFRRRLVAKLDDPFGVESFWATYEHWSEAEKVTNTASVLNKVRALASRSRLRGVLGQSDGAIDFRRLIRDRQILLVNLAAGRLGTEAAYLLGALLFAGLWDAVSARAGQPVNQRPVVMATLDEFQHLVALPTPAETVLAESRGYGLGMVLAHQHLGQLSSDLQQAVRVNARSKLVFATGRKDATALASELGGQVTPEDLMGIPAYEAVVSCFASGVSQPPATIATSPLPPALREAEDIYRRSRERYGVERVEVDLAIASRQRTTPEADARPVGRSRRSRS